MTCNVQKQYENILEAWLVKEYLTLHTPCTKHHVMMCKLAREDSTTMPKATTYLLKVKITERLFRTVKTSIKKQVHWCTQ